MPNNAGGAHQWECRATPSSPRGSAGKRRELTVAAMTATAQPDASGSETAGSVRADSDAKSRARKQVLSYLNGKNGHADVAVIIDSYDMLAGGGTVDTECRDAFGRITEISFDGELVEHCPADELEALNTAIAAADFGGDLHATVSTLRAAYEAARAATAARMIELIDDDEFVVTTSPDGTRALRSQTNGRYAQLIDTYTGAVLATYDRGSYHSGVNDMPGAFMTNSAGATFVVTASSWNNLIVCDPADGRPLRSPISTDGSFNGGLCVSADRTHLAMDAWGWHPVSFLMTTTADKLTHGGLWGSVGDAIDYGFRRPMCWCETTNGPLLAVFATDRDDGLSVDTNIEVFDVAGTKVATFTVDSEPIEPDFDDWALRWRDGLLAVEHAGVELAAFELPA